MPNLGDIDAQTISGALSTGTHGTGAAVRLPVHLRRGAHPGHRHRRGAALLGRRDTPTSSPPPGSGSARSASLIEVTLRCVDAFMLRAHERPAAAGRRAGRPPRPDRRATTTSSSTGSRTPTGRRSRPTTGCRPTTGRCPGWRGWLDDEFLSNTVFAGACRLGRAVPALAPTISADLRPGAHRTQLHRPLRPGLLHPAPGPLRGDGVRPAPRRAAARRSPRCGRIIDGLPFKVLFPVEVRFTAADDIWLSHGYGRDSAYIADPPVRRHAVRAVLPGFRGGRRRARRPAALGQAALPRRGVAAPGLPALRRLPAPSATRLDPQPGLRQRLHRRVLGA